MAGLEHRPAPVRTGVNPHGYLAIISTESVPRPWDREVGALIKRYSTNPAYVPFDMLAAWEQHGLWTPVGSQHTAPEPVLQSVNNYIEGFHAMSSLARSRMGPARAAAFDADLRQLVTPYARAGTLVFEKISTVQWGLPHMLEEIDSHGRPLSSFQDSSPGRSGEHQ